MTALSRFLCANATLMTMNGILGVRMYAVEKLYYMYFLFFLLPPSPPLFLSLHSLSLSVPLPPLVTMVSSQLMVSMVPV